MNETLGDFRLIRELGRGGMGIVYLAEQKSLGRQVALKVLPSHLTRSERQVQRFLREASAAARLHHPNIVAVHAVGEVDGTHFYAMDYIEGKSLGEVIDETRSHASGSGSGSGAEEWSWEGRRFNLPRPADPSRSGALPAVGKSEIAVAAGIGLRVAEALAYAHENGVIHRDIKPSNIVINSEGLPLVTDFGLAKEIGADKSLSAEGSVMGTPRYMSPEQAAGTMGSADHRTDIYSLGATLYELLTLTVPFEGKTYQEILRKIVVKEAEPIRRLNAGVPVDLETIVMKAMEKDPERRYQTAKEMAEDLQRFLNLQPIHARPASTASRCVKYLRRHREITMAVSVVALVVAGLLGWLTLRSARTSGQFASLVRDADVAFASARHDDAVSLLDRALGLRPGDPLAIEKRRAFSEERARQRGRSEEERAAQVRLEKSRVQAEAGDRAMVTWTSLRTQIAARRERLAVLLDEVRTYAGPDQKREMWGLEDELLHMEAERRDAYDQMLNSYHAAFTLADEESRRDLGQRLARVYYRTWEELRVLPSTTEAELERMAEQVERYDQDGEYRGLLEPEGTLNLVTDPPGASVYAYRYEQRQRRLQPLAFNLRERQVEAPPDRPSRASNEQGTKGYVAPRAGGNWPQLSLNHLGTTPIESVSLPVGSYLLRIVLEEHDAMNYPVLIEAGEVAGSTEPVPLVHDVDHPGPQWVYIPRGTSLVGGAILPHGSERLRPVTLDDYFIMKFEVTIGEYQEFLNDAEVRAEILRGVRNGNLTFVPREGNVPHILDFEAVIQDETAEIEINLSPDQSPDWPILMVSWQDAQRFVEWRNKDPELGVDWVFSLPTEEEWERAARGADGREFPWGRHFDWTFCKGALSRPMGSSDQALPDAVGAFPGDESPFGVRDMAGSVREWCADEMKYSNQLRVYKGGQWGEILPARFHLALQAGAQLVSTDTSLGFRLVCRAKP